jgi:hypothetical protein
METKITFFNIGNADTTLIQTKYGKSILWDYANMQGEKHCDLPKVLNEKVLRDYYDVVCFTHGDNDHVHGMKDYFYLEHAIKYQSKDRKRIKELWVPASVLLESSLELCDDAKALKAEAKYRFLTLKSGVKIFSKPDALKSWIESQGVDFNSISHLIVDAGTLVPGWTKVQDDLEVFVHSPFKGHVDDVNVIDRNSAAIIVQMEFGNKVNTKLILASDADSDNWYGIVKISRFHKNDQRLIWDIFHLPHHSSYKAINCSNKGINKTTPIPEVKWLFENQGKSNCLLISPSDVIPTIDTDQPPHRQAYNYYNEDVALEKSGNILVTMQTPNKISPQPIELVLTDFGFKQLEILTTEQKSSILTTIISKSPVSGNFCS